MEYRNPQYNHRGTIDCEVNHPVHGWIPFTADPNDVEEHGRVLYQRILAAGSIATYVPPTDEEVAADMRAGRDGLLFASDWTQLPDVPQSVKDAWAPYRQALRDITTQPGFPRNIVWPVPPS